jgi:hypothetical protein
VAYTNMGCNHVVGKSARFKYYFVLVHVVFVDEEIPNFHVEGFIDGDIVGCL